MLRILPTGMCFLLAWQIMLVNVLPASCMSVGGCSAVKASSVSCVNLSQFAFPQLVYDRLFCCIVCLLSVCVISCCCCMPFSTILVVNPGSPGLESSVLVSS